MVTMNWSEFLCQEPRKENEKEKKTEKKKEVPKVEISSVQIYSSASSGKQVVLLINKNYISCDISEVLIVTR